MECIINAFKICPKKLVSRLGKQKTIGVSLWRRTANADFTALGADCSVLDYSDKQLASEKYVADRENYKINIVKADMTKKLPFNDETFDIIFHPVSNCYIENVCHVWNECYRILKKGGVLLAGMDNGINFLFNDVDTSLEITNKLPFNPLKNKDQLKRLGENDNGIQFSHTLEEQIGGQLKSGFILKDLYEDYDNGGLLKEYIPTYIATRSIK
jgi:SAM-dependent methyltransferase